MSRTYRALTAVQRQVLTARGCCASDWDAIRVEEGFDPHRLRHVQLEGEVRIGRFGSEPQSGIQYACIADCTIGRQVRIAHIGIRLARYTIGDRVCIENVGLMETRPQAAFGNGVQIHALNESGQRPVILFNQLSAQYAYLMCVHRYRPGLVQKLAALARSSAAQVRSDIGEIGPNAQVRSTRQIIDVAIGPSAVIDGASRLVNGTILSTPEAPSVLGSDVQCKDFIVAEGSSVSQGAMLSQAFVGQGCTIGKQFSAQHALFFANCEALHGEAVHVFAGPYTVSHHKSTLLIAGIYSFCNAGSGTNQSNHLYKLGPVHEGKLERGTKTGSFAYLLWPCRIGPFSIVIGKHRRHLDTADLPFSLLVASAEGDCRLGPALNLATCGTVRDGAKWPTRDKRRADSRRDRIVFDVFNPYTVGRMRNGQALLEASLARSNARDDVVSLGGAQVKRELLAKGRDLYGLAIQVYLLEKVLKRCEQAVAANADWTSHCACGPDSVYSNQWLDIAGQIMPRVRLDELTKAIDRGQLDSIEAIERRFDEIQSVWPTDEWAWVRTTWQQVFASELERASKSELIVAFELLCQLKERFCQLVLSDARQEFSPSMRLGYGLDGAGTTEQDEDFAQVRGTFNQNPFVRQIRNELISLRQRVERLKGQWEES